MGNKEFIVKRERDRQIGYCNTSGHAIDEASPKGCGSPDEGDSFFLGKLGWTVRALP